MTEINDRKRAPAEASRRRRSKAIFGFAAIDAVAVLVCLYCFELQALALLVLLPAFVAFVAVVLASLDGPVPILWSLPLGLGSCLIAGVVFSGFEATFWLVMLLPLWGPPAAVGALLARTAAREAYPMDARREATS